MVIDTVAHTFTLNGLYLFGNESIKIFMSEDFINAVEGSISMEGTEKQILDFHELTRERTEGLISPEIADFSIRYYCYMVMKVLGFLKDKGFPINNTSAVVHCMPDYASKTGKVAIAGAQPLESPIEFENKTISFQIVYDARVFKEGLYKTFIHEIVHYFLASDIKPFYMKFVNGKLIDVSKELVYERMTDSICYLILPNLSIIEDDPHWSYFDKQLKKNPNYPSEYLEKRITELKLNGILK